MALLAELLTFNIKSFHYFWAHWAHKVGVLLLYFGGCDGKTGNLLFWN